MRVARDLPPVVASDTPAGLGEPFPVDFHDSVDAYRWAPVTWGF